MLEANLFLAMAIGVLALCCVQLVEVGVLFLGYCIKKTAIVLLYWTMLNVCRHDPSCSWPNGRRLDSQSRAHSRRDLARRGL